MARQIPESELVAIEDAVQRYPEGAAFSEIVKVIPSLPHRTLQARIKRLVDTGRLVRKGNRRGARYFLPEAVPGEAKLLTAVDTDLSVREAASFVPLSKAGKEIQKLVTRPLSMREPVGYDYAFLQEYTPNDTFYLTKSQREHLYTRGRGELPPAPAGTYARDILNRLLIDLSWNSSRLEGNTYSILDTERLIRFGRTAKGKNAREATMILNHKAAIEFEYRWFGISAPGRTTSS